MKKLLKLLGMFILFIIAAVIVMWIFKICPPQGPWPMPPWCDNSQTSEAYQQSDTAKAGITQQGSANQGTGGQQSKTDTTGKGTAAGDTVWQQPQEYLNMISGPGWLPADSVTKITTGHTFMDLNNTFLFKNRFAPTIKSMKSNNAQWAVFDNYNSYHSLNPPVIGTYTDTSEHSFRHATDAELKTMIETTHQNGLKFALMTELSFDVAQGKFTTWEENEKFWKDSQALLDKMGSGLDKPTSEQTAYWDKWFAEYTKFIMSNASAAQKYGADMLVIGKQIDGAVRMGNTQRWKKLIQEVRSVYQGPIGYAGFTNNDYTQFQECGFISDLDSIIIYMYNAVSQKENPSIAELKDSFERIIDKQADYYYEQTGKKVILLTPFQSRDYGAKQVWFEPAAPAPGVKQDLLIQAKMYEALFQALSDEKSVEMVWTWGYWWLENDFNREQGSQASSEKSSTVRNKPAAEVIKKWSKTSD